MTMNTEMLDPRYRDLDLWPTGLAVEAMLEAQMAAVAALQSQSAAIAAAAEAAASGVVAGPTACEPADGFTLHLTGCRFCDIGRLRARL